MLTTPAYGLIAYGMLSNKVSNTLEFLQHNSENWIVQLLFAYIVSVKIFITWWVYFYGGAQFYLTHPGTREYALFGYGKKATIKNIKIVYFIQLIILIATIVAIIYFDLISLFFAGFPNQ